MKASNFTDAQKAFNLAYVSISTCLSRSGSK